MDRYNVFCESKLEFKHQCNKNISGLSYKTASAIQVLKTFGKDQVDVSIIMKLKKLLPMVKKEKHGVEEKTTAWVYSYIRKVCIVENKDI